MIVELSCHTRVILSAGTCMHEHKAATVRLLQAFQILLQVTASSQVKCPVSRILRGSCVPDKVISTRTKADTT